MTDKPDYVANFQKPVNTEIKHINGHWYLYERSNYYDPAIKRSRKRSGKMIGTITPEGLVPSRRNQPKPLNDVVEIGAISYFYQKTEPMRARLQKHFPDCWERIYTIALTRAIYDTRFRRVELHYQDSILSYMYPKAAVSPASISGLLDNIGRRRSDIRDFMLEDLPEHDRFILFDGHRLLSASKTMDNAELGYDSKMRYKPQINVVYMFSLGENTGHPAYYKQYIGSTPDVSAFTDVIRESDVYGDNCTVVTDKGFASDDGVGLLEENGLNYIMPLKRGNRFVSGKVPSSPYGYDSAFTYHERSIHCSMFEEDDCNIHLYLDTDLFAEEDKDLIRRTETHNQTIEKKRQKEEARRSNGKGRLTDEQLAALVPVSIKDVTADHAEMGTITIRTNRKDLNSEQVYQIFKQRQAIEQYFKTYGDTIEFEGSYMRSNYSEEAWLFLNHLSSMICIDAIEEIAAAGKSKDISYKDLVQSLVKIKACRIDDRWQMVPVKLKVQSLCSKLHIDINDISALDLR